MWVGVKGNKYLTGGTSSSKAFGQLSLPEVHLRKTPDFPSLPVGQTPLL
jgi:hypothetical protein